LLELICPNQLHTNHKVLAGDQISPV